MNGHLEIPFRFGPADTEILAIVMNSSGYLRYAVCRPSDISGTGNGIAAALVSETTYTIYKNGVQVGQITTSGANFIQADITDIYFGQGDTLAVKPSAAAGTDRSVCVTLIG